MYVQRLDHFIQQNVECHEIPTSYILHHYVRLVHINSTNWFSFQSQMENAFKICIWYYCIHYTRCSMHRATYKRVWLTYSRIFINDSGLCIPFIVCFVYSTTTAQRTMYDVRWSKKKNLLSNSTIAQFNGKLKGWILQSEIWYVLNSIQIQFEPASMESDGELYARCFRYALRSKPMQPRCHKHCYDK